MRCVQVDNFQNGGLYFISDNFFEKVNDPCLKSNKGTSRPHYFVFQDIKTNLLWMIPCSSQIDKFSNIIRKKQEQGKTADGLKIVSIHGIEQALLFQDMFPIASHYIIEPYIRQNAHMSILNPSLVADIEKQAAKVIGLIRRGVKFTPTQPDSIRIEQIMIQELQTLDNLEFVKHNAPEETSTRTPLAERLNAAKSKLPEPSQTKKITPDRGR